METLEMQHENSNFDSCSRLSGKRWRLIWLKTAGAALLCCAQAVAAAPAAPAQPVTLEEYLRLVARNQPALAAEQLQVDAARADTRGARALPNPTVGYSRQPSERQWSIDQPLPIFGQRGARIENARRGEAAAAAHAQAAVTSALDEAAHAFNELLVAQRRLQVWQEASQELERAGRIVRGQIEAGARSRYDGARLDLRQAQMAMQVAKADAAVQEAAGRAAALAALPAWAPRAEGSLQAGPAAQAQDFALLWHEASARLAGVRAAQADLDQARQKVEPDQAALRLDAAALAAQSSLRLALQQVQLRRASVLAYEKEGLSRIAPLHQMAQDAYKLGQGGILELIDALGSIAEHRLEHLDLVKDMLDAEWQLRVATGNVPDVGP
jgi:cobalt-zinc-cadmium efflux system outer membrane protein